MHSFEVHSNESSRRKVDVLVWNKSMVVKVGCLVYLAALLISCLGGSVLKVDIAGAVKKKV